MRLLLLRLLRPGARSWKRGEGRTKDGLFGWGTCGLTVKRTARCTAKPSGNALRCTRGQEIMEETREKISLGAGSRGRGWVVRLERKLVRGRGG